MTQRSPTIPANFADGRLHVDTEALRLALDALAPDAVVVVLIHGYRFQPGNADLCPHRHILSPDPQIKDGREISWPLHLGLDGKQGLAIALGWPAGGSLWQAHRQAAAVGKALAEFATEFRRIAPDRPLHVVAHSLGTRVALRGLALAVPGDFGRLVLLSGAETRSMARHAMASPAGHLAEVVNVTSRENDLFDAAFEWLLHFGRHWSIGQGLGEPVSNWHDLWLDQRQTLAALAQLGFPLTAPTRRISHWSPYLRPGVFAFYSAFLRGDLRAAALPKPVKSRRWSLLLTWSLRPHPARYQAAP